MMKKFVCSCVLLLGICLSFQANAQKINLDFNQAELGQVLEEIHKQTGYVFYYSQPPVAVSYTHLTLLPTICSV